MGKNFILGCSGMCPMNVLGIVTNYASMLEYLVVLLVNFTQNILQCYLINWNCHNRVGNFVP